jgi:biopolymer transport protein ExbD
LLVSSNPLSFDEVDAIRQQIHSVKEEDVKKVPIVIVGNQCVIWRETATQGFHCGCQRLNPKLRNTAKPSNSPPVFISTDESVQFVSLV